MPSVLQQSTWVAMVGGRTGRDDMDRTTRRAGRGHWADTIHVIGGQCRAVEGRGGHAKEMEEAARKIEGPVKDRRKKKTARGIDKQAQEENRGPQTQAGKMAAAATFKRSGKERLRSETSPPCHFHAHVKRGRLSPVARLGVVQETRKRRQGETRRRPNRRTWRYTWKGLRRRT